MKTIIEKLQAHSSVSGYKINTHRKESFELFFVKGRLETVRCTDTCDKEVTVYAEHDGFQGDAQFFVYPSTTEDQLSRLIDDAVSRALLIKNKPYSLPAPETGVYEVESNFRDFTPADLAATVAKAVFDANTVPNASLNSVEVFINHHTETVCNSRGLHKTQTRYDAMVEAIPTYNGETQSVELYEQYNFSALDLDSLTDEIAGKMAEVKARCEAVTPDFPMNCKVILGIQELSQLFRNIAWDLDYSGVYSHSNLFKKGDAIQKEPSGDPIGISMTGEVTGSVRSARFDADGMSLGTIRLVENGKVLNYYGSNRFGQYLGETPTGVLPCLCADPGTLDAAAFREGPCLEIISMSGLQVDIYSDYIGGEVRLAYYHDGGELLPVTGISISGKLSQVLSSIRFSADTAVYGGYFGPTGAILEHMAIF